MGWNSAPFLRSVALLLYQVLPFQSLGSPLWCMLARLQCLEVLEGGGGNAFCKGTCGVWFKVGNWKAGARWLWFGQLRLSGNPHFLLPFLAKCSLLSVLKGVLGTRWGWLSFWVWIFSRFLHHTVLGSFFFFFIAAVTSAFSIRDKLLHF